MTARPRLEVRMLVRALKLQLAEGQALVSSLNSLVTQKWAANVVNGQTVLSTSEAGGSVTFTFERAYTPAELAVMAEEALEWVNTLANPENPPLDVARYNRLHGTFHRLHQSGIDEELFDVISGFEAWVAPLQPRPQSSGRGVRPGLGFPTVSVITPSAWLRAQVGQISRITDTPHALAVGVAVGVFFGFVPLVGLKTLLALAVARLLRGSVLVAAVVVTLHDVLLPVAPLLLRWEYDIGYWLMSHPHAMPPHLHLQHHSPLVWLHWSTFITVGRPLLVGSVALAAPLAVASYFLALAWGRRRVRG